MPAMTVAPATPPKSAMLAMYAPFLMHANFATSATSAALATSTRAAGRHGRA